MFDFLKITSDEFDGSLIDFRGNRSQFSTGRPVFLDLKQFLYVKHS